MRVLIVDDDAGVRELLQFICETEGHVIETARNVPDALAIWRSSRPDCVLLDLGLPGHPGTDLLRRIRGAGDLTPVIVISGDLRSDRRRLVMQLGATAAIPKPFELRAVKAALRAAHASTTAGDTAHAMNGAAQAAAPRPPLPRRLPSPA